ncbi:hypothetical protein BDW75DRAFT_242661 [Aspergillus navahoensis]
MPTSLSTLQSSLPLPLPLVTILALLILRLLWRRFGSSLRGIPGPVLAKCTRLWKLHSAWEGDHHLTEINLHRQHGPLVRIGPRHVSVADPKAIPVIYGLNKGFTKTGFYPIQCISWNKRPQMNLFSTRDEKFHRDQKRPVTNAYSMTSLLELEPAVDSCTTLFLSHLGDFADKERPVDLGTWLQYYAFDVVGEFTFAKKARVLEEGRKVEDMMAGIQGILTYANLTGQIPEAHKVLLGNPLIPILMPTGEFTDESSSGGDLEKGDLEEGKDMLSRWMTIHVSDLERMSTRDVIVHLSTKAFAGSDTTAIALRAIVYFLLNNPEKMKKVVGEIDAADSAGHLSSPISYKESMEHLPNLAAVIKEAMRLHPSVGLILERHVREGGVTVYERHILAGTTVGINAWALHHDEKVFPDPKAFIPERWLESTLANLKEMKQSFFAFGAGSRTCVGKNISLIKDAQDHRAVAKGFYFPVA